MYYFIVNPNAGGGNGGRVWKLLAERLKKLGVEYEAYLTAGQGEARTIAHRLTDGNRDPMLIIAVGGDGTMNEILDGLSLGGAPSLGYIPAGTGNDLARSLRLSENPLRCLKHLLSPRRCLLLDYGVLTYGQQEIFHRRFLVSAGIGFDGAVCHDLLNRRKTGFLQRLGLNRLGYVTAGLRQLLRWKPTKGYIVLDGVKKVEFNHIAFVSCHIQPYEGGGFKLAPKASPRDGQLSVCVVNCSQRLRLLPVLLSSIRGRHGKRKGVRTFECRDAQIHMERPLPVHADGESCGLQTDLQVGCVARKLRMLGW